MRLYWILAIASIKKNQMYVWAHMANNVGSALFGFIYMSLWRAAAHGKAIGSFQPQDLVAYIAVGQLILWLSTFLPRDLGVSDHIRTGQIALELSRPIGYLPRMFVSGAGEVLYNVIFRALPLGLVFYVLGDLPIIRLASPSRAVLFVCSLVISSTVGLLMQYLIGISAFWTIETRWARSLYYVFALFCGGQLLPLRLMPPLMRTILTWMPFQSLISFPTNVWLGMDTLDAWVSAIGWCLLIITSCSYLTRLASRRLVVQGG